MCVYRDSWVIENIVLVLNCKRASFIVFESRWVGAEVIVSAIWVGSMVYSFGMETHDLRSFVVEFRKSLAKWNLGIFCKMENIEQWNIACLL